MTGRCCCRNCQKLSGGGHADNLAYPEASVTVTGQPRDFCWTADSGGTVTTSFCPQCGSPLFGRSSSMPGLLVLRAGSLDDPSVYSPQMVVYLSSRQPWVTLDPNLPTFETMPTS
tara:strand:+ start:4161 stop:4505 length:345 start_codon:yes stop_codon:yes gene_type:complete